MLSRTDKQQIMLLAIKPRLSQLPGRYVFTCIIAGVNVCMTS